MKRFLRLLIASIAALHAAAAAATDTAPQIATAARDTLAVRILLPAQAPTPTQAASAWTLDGTTATAVGRATVVESEGTAAQGYPLVLRHTFYVRMGEAIAAGSHTLRGPGVSITFEHDSRTTLCECIKIDQAGYAGGPGASAYAAVYRGDLGADQLVGATTFSVFEWPQGATVHTGSVQPLGWDLSGPSASGDFVYRLDLASIPAGGPYAIELPGIGRSLPFEVGADTARKTAFTTMRGLYHQRCGIALEAAYTPFVRATCHGQVQVTDAEPAGFITASGPVRAIAGGYHDAGDFDRRQFHTLIPAWLLAFHEAFPRVMPDGSLQLPESGNGIPDLLDEALWGTKIWEELQEPDGGVRAGTETNAHPAYGQVTAATDTLVYRTYRRDRHATASAAGMFAQASRLLRPYDAARAAVLLEKSKRAWIWAESQGPCRPAAQCMYASLQLWLATGEEAFHERFKAYVETLDGAQWPQQYHVSYFSLPTVVDGMVFTPYFVSYLLQTPAGRDAGTAATLDRWLANAVDTVIARAGAGKYPAGAPTQTGWGSLTNQGRYAEPLIYRYRLTGNPALRAKIQEWASYPLGNNPLGRSYVTGLGIESPRQPLHLDSYFAPPGLGPVPGITLYGPMQQPSEVAYQKLVWEKIYPAWNTLPSARRYTEGWSLVPVNEFSTTETIALNAVMYAFMSDGTHLLHDGFENRVQQDK